jgi:hypothetical protein
VQTFFHKGQMRRNQVEMPAVGEALENGEHSQSANSVDVGGCWSLLVVRPVFASGAHMCDCRQSEQRTGPILPGAAVVEPVLNAPQGHGYGHLRLALG